jgi:TfoX/Sxy family transcriptional regulator of competence genes
MFGEYGIYSGDKFFGLICNDSLFLKSTPALRLLLSDDGVRPYVGASDGYFHIPDTELEEPEILKKYVIASLDFISKPKKHKEIK